MNTALVSTVQIMSYLTFWPVLINKKVSTGQKIKASSDKNYRINQKEEEMIWI